MLNKFLLSGLLLTSSLATITTANAMDGSDEQKLVLPAKKLAKGWKNEVFKEGNGVYYVAGTVENRQMFKMENDFTGVKSGGVFVFNRPGICNLTVKLLSSIDSQQESSQPNLIQSLQNIHLSEQVEKKKISSAPGTSSDFEMVKYESGNLVLSQGQMRKAIETGILKTERGTFSVVSGGYFDSYWNPEISCIPRPYGFQFTYDTGMAYTKKFNSETNQWEDDYNQPSMFMQKFNSETNQWEDDLDRLLPYGCNLQLTRISIDSQQESSQPNLVQSLQNIHLPEHVEEEKVSSTSSKSSDFEIVKYEYGSLVLSQDQMRKAIETGILKTDHGTFSVTSSGFLNYYWNPEISCHPTHNGFEFIYDTGMAYTKKFNSETNQWEDDYNQPSMFMQKFNSETNQWEDDFTKPVTPSFILNLTKLQD